jgi:FkbM family methyltransferase
MSTHSPSLSGYFVSGALASLGMAVFHNAEVPPILSTPLAARHRNLPVVDIGTNVGLDLTIPAAQLGHTVYSFEPTPATYGKLLRNLGHHKISFSQDLRDQNLQREHRQQRTTVDKGNATRGHVFALNMAVSNRSGVAVLVQDRRGGVSNSLNGAAALPKNWAASTVSVNVTTLDSILQHEEQGLFLLKMDSQGHEYHILTGALEYIKTHPVYAVLLEYYPKGMAAAGVDPLDLLYLLYGQLGLQCFDIGPSAAKTSLSLEDFAQKAYPVVIGTRDFGGWTDLLCLNFRLV